MTSQHKDLTRQLKDLTSQHNYLKKNMPYGGIFLPSLSDNYVDLSGLYVVFLDLYDDIEKILL